MSVEPDQAILTMNKRRRVLAIHQYVPQLSLGFNLGARPPDLLVWEVPKFHYQRHNGDALAGPYSRGHLSGTNMNLLQALIEQFQTLLAEAGKDRNEREQFVPRLDGKGTEPAWVTHERKLMHEAVNRERAKRSKKPLALEEVASVEQLALGHSDYAQKYALYCAELVLQER